MANATGGCQGGHLSQATGSLTFSEVGDGGGVTQQPAGQVRIDFGNLPVGGSTTLELSLSSAGVPVKVQQVTTVTADPDLSFPLAPQTEVTQSGTFLSVGFRPTKLGSHQAVYQVDTDDRALGTVTVTLVGVGVPFSLEVTPNPVDFGPVVVNQSKRIELTVTNLGDAGVPLELSGPLGPDGGNQVSSFHLDPVSSLLAAGQSVTLSASFAPILATSQPEEASFVLSACPQCPGVTVVLQGQGVQGALYPVPAVVNFGFVQLGHSASQPLRLVNVSQLPGQVTAAPVLTQGGVSPGPFGAGWDAGAAGFPVQLDAGDAFEVDLSFTPGYLSPFNGSIDIASDDVSTPTLRVPLEGFGGGGQLSCLPSDLPFGPVLLGQTLQQFLVCSNIGSDVPGHPEAALVLYPPTLDGGAGYMVSSFDDAGTTLTVGGSLSIGVSFAPLDAGEISAALRIGSNDPNQAAVLALSGLGVAAGACQLMAIPTGGLDFGVVPPGASPQLQVGVVNVGSNFCEVGGVSLAPGSDSAFSLIDLPAIPVLLSFPGNPDNPAALRNQLAVDVQFAPSDAGQVGGTVAFTVDGPAPSAASVAVAGTGGIPCLSATPAALEFGSVAFDATAGKACSGSALTLTLSNSCSSPVTLSGASVSAGVAPALQFLLLDPPDAGVNIPAGGSLKYAVQFNPSAPGAVVGSLDLVESDLSPGQLRRVPLSGSAVSSGPHTDHFTYARAKVDLLLEVDDDDDFYTEKQVFPILSELINSPTFAELDYHVGVIEPCASLMSYGDLEPCPGCFNHQSGEATIVTPNSLPSPQSALEDLLAPFLARGDYAAPGNCLNNLLSAEQLSSSARTPWRISSPTPMASNSRHSTLQLLPKAVPPSRLYLVAFPASGSLEVLVNGVPTPQSVPGVGTYIPEWSYDPATNSVTFSTGYIPRPGDEVSISYQVACG